MDERGHVGSCGWTTAGCTCAFVCSLLCADSPLATSASDLSRLCGNVVHQESSWHLGVIMRSESQLDQPERLKSDQQHIEPPCTNGSSFWTARMLRNAIGVLDMFTKMRRGMRRTRRCRILYFEVHGDFNAADRAAIAPVSAPATPPVRSQEGRQAPSTLEKQSEQRTRQDVVHAKLVRVGSIMIVQAPDTQRRDKKELQEKLYTDRILAEAKVVQQRYPTPMLCARPNFQKKRCMRLRRDPPSEENASQPRG